MNLSLAELWADLQGVAPRDLAGLLIRLSAGDGISPSWHPLGFVHAEIARSPGGETLRVHIFDKRLRNPIEQLDKVHDHRFQVDSRLMSGAVCNRVFDFRERHNGDFREVRVNYSSGGAYLTEAHIFGDLIQRESIVVEAPSVYSIKTGTLHCTEPATTSALTLVRTSPASAYAPRVIFRKGREDMRVRVRVPFPLEQWMELVNRALLH